MKWMPILALMCAFMMCGDLSADNERYQYLLFYKEQDESTSQMQQTLKHALAKLGDKASSVEIDVSDPSNDDIVKAYNLRRSPMPLILVIAPNGAIASGFPLKVTEENLLSAVMTEAMADTLKALQNRRLVLLSVQNHRTSKNSEAIASAKAFQTDPRFSAATETIFIDSSNHEEQAFLKQLGVDPTTPVAMTVVIAPPSKVVGKYEGSFDKDALISDLKKASTGCCPGGCCNGCCCH
ncbi:MAG: hypothetical protein Q8K75_03405 [Chlamydiales bacterium]|nr:hypothetical protein [Chlamydiales bacterium]